MLPRIVSTTALIALVLTASPAIAQALHGKPTRGTGIKPDVLYHNYCSVCHGDRGDGNSRAANSLNPPPRDFQDASNLGREHMIAVIQNGKPGTAMVGWGSQLSKGEVESVADYIRATFMRTVLEPRIRKGREIYVSQCAKCHGDRGQGIANPAIGLNVAPRDLTTPQARANWSRDAMIEIVRFGRSGTMMISYRDQLPKADIENVVDYVRAALMIPESSISGTSAHGGRERDAAPAPISPAAPRADMTLPLPSDLKGDRAWGMRFFNDNCASCHGTKGDGQGPRAYFINPRPASFISDKSLRTLNRPTIYTHVAAGKLGTEMPAWRHVLTPQEMANVAEYVFTTFIAPNQPKAEGTRAAKK